MADQKRQIRQWKRELKKFGNRQRRRFLKSTEAEADDFDFGRLRSETLNGETGTSHKRHRQNHAGRSEQGTSDDPPA